MSKHTDKDTKYDIFIACLAILCLILWFTGVW